MNALKQQREIAMLSQSELAEKSGIGTHQINKIENGRAVPWPRTVRKLAAGLKCNVSDLASLRTERGETNGQQEQSE